MKETTRQPDNSDTTAWKEYILLKKKIVQVYVDKGNNTQFSFW